MYDYLSVYSDMNYSCKIKTEVYEKFLLNVLKLKKESSLKFSKELNGEHIILTGIMANANGSYAFNTLDDISEINLVEISVPQKLDEEIEEEITAIAIAIAKEYAWIVFDNETSSKIYP